MSQVDQTYLLRQVRLALQDQKFDAAIEYLNQAATLAHTSGDFGAEGRHLGNLALIYYRLNQPQRALEYFEQALDRARVEGDKLTEDGLLGNMGNILRELKRYDEAVTYLNQALLIANEIGDIRGRGIWLGNLGLVYDDLKEPEKAVEYHQQSVSIARQLEDRRGLVSRLSNLGNSYIMLSDYPKALKIFEEAVTYYEVLGDKQGLALRLGVIGNLYGELGRLARTSEEALHNLNTALTFYQRTLIIARELGDLTTEAELFRSMGNAYGNMGDFDKAIANFTHAYKLFERLNLKQQSEHVRQSIELAIHYQNSGA